MEVVRAQHAAGTLEESTYVLHIVPQLWLLTQRTDYRIFQHKSVVEIVDELLERWKVARAWKLDDRSRYPKLDYKVQYGETDYAFMARILAEWGIAFTFPDDNNAGSKVTFNDNPGSAEARSNNLRFVDEPNQAAEAEFITDLQLTHHVRSGACVIRDYDFRKPGFPLWGRAVASGDTPESRYELSDYQPGAFVVQTDPDGKTPVADEKGAARHDAQTGRDLARRTLEAERVDRRAIAFTTNTVDLWPGVVFSIDNHAHSDLAATNKLLMTEYNLQGTPEGEWATFGEAVFTVEPYRPRIVPKPRAYGVQSATVVGRAGEEIDTDEHGRVRVQFPWCRQGNNDDNSSCWIRVSHTWAGAGFGFINLPRVGQEVLVSFLEGDPDQPVITGRVFNVTQPVPYKLPKHKTRSTWRSCSSPGGDGFNEIMFEDLAGSELVYVQAEKDLRKLVKNDETITVGHDRQKLVKNDETETTKKDRTEVVGGRRVEITQQDRITVIGENRGLLVQGAETRRTEGTLQRFVGESEHVIVNKDRRDRVGGDRHWIVDGNRMEKVVGDHSLTVGGDRQAQITGKHAVSSGSEIHLKAGMSMVLEAALDLTIKGPGGFIRIDPVGVSIVGTLVKINCGGVAGIGSGARPSSASRANEAKIERPAKPEPDDVSETGLAQ